MKKFKITIEIEAENEKIFAAVAGVQNDLNAMKESEEVNVTISIGDPVQCKKKGPKKNLPTDNNFSFTGTTNVGPALSHPHD